MKLLRRLRVVALLVIGSSVLVYLVHPATLGAVGGALSGWLAAAPHALPPLLARVRSALAGITLTQLLIGAAVAWLIFVLVLVLLARSGRPRQAAQDAQGPPEQVQRAPEATGAPSSPGETQPASSPARLPPLAILPEYDTPWSPASAPASGSQRLDPSLAPSGERSRNTPRNTPRVMPFVVPASSLQARREPEYDEWPPPTSSPRVGAMTTPHPDSPAAEHPGRGHVVALTGVSPAGDRLLPYGLFLLAEDAGTPAGDGAASRRALRLIAEQLVPTLASSRALAAEPLTTLFELAIIKAGIDLRQQGIENAAKPAVHVTGILIVDTRASVVSAGDCRVFVFRPGSGVVQAAPDHPVVASVPRGEQPNQDLDPDAVDTHPRKDRLYPCIGGSDGASEVKGVHIRMEPNDLFVLCSSSLWHALHLEQIEAILRAAPSLNGAAYMLARAGGRDSIAVIVRTASEQMPEFGLARQHAALTPSSGEANAPP